MTRHVAWALLISALIPAAVRAERPAVKAVRVEKGPVVDGRLDDPAWRSAEAFARFRQVFPRPDAEPSERTEVRFVFDETALYVGFRGFDAEPSKIVANTLAHDGARGGNNAGDDLVRILLDPVEDKRNAYLFIVNARGARTEGLAFGEHSSFNWDGIWQARSRIDADGWTAEIEIPFKSIAFKPELPTWGVNVERYIPRKQETIRLAGVRRDAFFNNAAEAAALEGVGGMRQGLGLTFRPYGTAGTTSAGEDGRGRTTEADGGFDLYKSFTPNFLGALSFNTDFAETEVDERRLNLTRFALYFPEKRTFFLEGSEIFNFAGQTGGGSGGPSFVPFFSRRIGLLEGEPVPLLFGAKVFGKVGRTNISLLDVRTRRHSFVSGGDEAVSLGGQNFVAGRIYQNIWAESKVGMIFTHGSPDGTRNTLAGLDFTFQTSRFRGDQNFSATGWYVRNWNARTEGRHHGFGFKLDYPNDLWDIVTSYSYYGDALDPGLGFLPRPGVQTYSLGLDYMPRPEKGWVGEVVRQFFYELRFSFFWDLDGRLETRRVFLAPFNIRTESGEHLEFNLTSTRDVLPYDFEISDGVVLPGGPYDFTNFSAQVSTASHRPWGLDLEYAFGPFYSGRYQTAQIGLSLRFKGYASLQVSSEVVRANLPQGRFRENVFELKADFFFSADLGLMNYIQYDDVSKNLGVNVRFRWQISPGNEIFFVYTKNWERRWDPESRFFPLGDRGVVKIQFSLRP
jgi:hypothetical protein